MKKGGELFDVTMDAYEGAEICELVGLFILYKFQQLNKMNKFGLYRDDELAVVKGALSRLRQLSATGSPLEIMKNAFYFTSKAIFVLKIFNFLP